MRSKELHNGSITDTLGKGFVYSIFQNMFLQSTRIQKCGLIPCKIPSGYVLQRNARETFRHVIGFSESLPNYISYPNHIVLSIAE